MEFWPKKQAEIEKKEEAKQSPEEDLKTKEKLAYAEILKEKVIKPMEDTLITEAKQEAYLRADGLGVDHAEVDSMFKNVTDGWLEELFAIRDELPTRLNRLRERINNSYKIPAEEKAEFNRLITMLDFDRFLEILKKRAVGSLYGDDIELVALMNLALDGTVSVTQAYHDIFKQTIHMPLLSGLDKNSAPATFAHEVTHGFLNRFNYKQEQSLRKVILAYNIAKLKNDHEFKDEFKYNIEFIRFLGALNESLAFAIENYYSKGAEKEPDFESYRNELNPEFFKTTYENAKILTGRMTLAQFDKFSADVYTTALSFYHAEEGITGDEFNELAMVIIKKFQKYFSIYKK